MQLNFKKPSHADDSELTDDDIIIRYEKGYLQYLMRVEEDKQGKSLLKTAYNLRDIRIFLVV